MFGLKNESYVYLPHLLFLDFSLADFFSSDFSAILIIISYAYRFQILNNL